MMPKVETFEHNIAEEIKRKEASLTEISAASNNVGNDPVELPKKPPIFFVVLVVLFVLCLLGFGLLGYFYITSIANEPAPTISPVTTEVTKKTFDISTLSPTLSEQIGRFVTRVEKKEQGYILTINNYSSVFAYMARNEDAYIQELTTAFSTFPVKTATTTTATATTTEETKKEPETKTIGATTTQGTSTRQTPATNTQILPQNQPAPESVIITEEAPSFTDVTLSNQNMRIFTSGKVTVVYAFVGNTTILISGSKEGILALKSAILK